MKRCKCSYLGHPTRACVCSEEEVRRYRSRLSGPLLDRIDLHVTLSPVPTRLLSGGTGAEDSQAIRERVESARERQRARYVHQGRTGCNAQAGGRILLRAVTADARELLEIAADSLGLSARAYHRVVKVARTIADLDAEERVNATHVAEALRYRAQTAT